MSITDPTRVGNAAQALEQGARTRRVELRLDPHRGRAEGRLEPLERLAGSARRRTQDELRLDALLAEIAGDRLRRAPPATRQRAIKIGEIRILPTRLRVPEQIEAPHREDRDGSGVRAASRRATLVPWPARAHSSGHGVAASGASAQGWR
jgi:hypothetical protein